jgi:hypothetical protein
MKTGSKTKKKKKKKKREKERLVLYFLARGLSNDPPVFFVSAAELAAAF